MLFFVSIFTASVLTCQKLPLNPWDPEGIELGYVTASPCISFDEGVYNKDISLEITCEDTNAVIYYTTDGTDPDESSAKYEGTIDISGDGTSIILKAIAVNPSKIPSHVVAASYNIDYLELSVISGGNGSVTPVTTVKTAKYSASTITAAADSTYAFSHWSVESGSGVEIEDVYSATTTVTLTEGDASVKANFDIGIALTVSNDGNGTTTPDGEILVVSGIPRSIKAKPTMGYIFSGWSIVSGSSVTIADASSAETTVSITGVSEVRADFEIITYQLTVSTAGNGSTTPSGASTVDYGDATSISTTPDAGYQFYRWVVINGEASIANASSSSTTATLTSGDAEIQAEFIDLNADLTVLADGNGSTSPSGTVTINQNIPYSISAIANTDYGFSHWSVESGVGVSFDDESSANAMVTLTGGDAAVKANFLPTYQLTVTNDGNGTTNPSGTITVTEGISENIYAYPSSGYVFSHWFVESGTGVTIVDELENTTQINLSSGDVEIKAYFLPVYTLSITYSGEGMVNPEGDTDITQGESFAISATPAEGYHFNGWTIISGNPEIVDNSSVSTSVVLNSGNAEIRAEFELNTYTLTITDDGTGTTNPSGSITVSHGVETSISATPLTGYGFSQWSRISGEGVSLYDPSTSNPYVSSLSNTTVTLTEGDAAVKANFLPYYTLTIQNNGNGSTSPSDSIEVLSGDWVFLTAEPNSGYIFNRWSVESGTDYTLEYFDFKGQMYIELTSGDVIIQANFIDFTTGPAGGIVFYDKGAYSDGWRYLEASTIDQTSSIVWGPYDYEVGTSYEIGTGAANTSAIVTALGDNDGASYAAQLCDELVSGGYSDWFLPSRQALITMYLNLHLSGYGNFDGSYWSSTEQGEDYASRMSFSSGSLYGSAKIDGFSVRAIRAY